MVRPTPSPLEARVRQARRRLFTQTLLNRVGLAWGVALALALAWFVVEPFVLPLAADWLKWAVLGGLAGVATVVGIGLARRAAPSPLSTALEIDQRFALDERVTTALGLSPPEQSSPAGQALLADANARLERVAVKGKFPVRLGWRALFLPAQAAAIAVLALYPPPILTTLAGGGTKADDKEQAKNEEKENKAQAKATKPQIKPVTMRQNKSEDLRQLEEQLEQLYGEFKVDKPGQDKPEEVRERQEKIAAAEDRLKKREQELTEKFQKLQDQMNKLTDLKEGENAHDGPGKDFEQALAKGDLKKAQDDLDRLSKKAREKKLDEKEQEQLKKQMEDLNKKVDQLTREQKEKEKKLKDLIDQAKRENRDAEALERELKNLQQDQQMAKEMQELSQALKQCKKCLEQNDMDGLADQLSQMGKQLGDIDGELKDLDDIEDHLQNLREMKKAGCKECEGDKDGKNGSDKDNAKGRAEGASGKRPENKDAVMNGVEENRVRGFFDPKGRKSYGGSTNGPAFKKASSVEMATDIKQAVQEAPEAVEVQRLPKAAKEMVKEYFEKLGNQAPPDKK